MITNMLVISISNINFIHGCIITGVNSIYVIIILALPLLSIHKDVVVDTTDDASMDASYVSYVDDEHNDNHDCDDNTDDDHVNINDIYGIAMS